MFDSPDTAQRPVEALPVEHPPGSRTPALRLVTELAGENAARERRPPSARLADAARRTIDILVSSIVLLLTAPLLLLAIAAVRLESPGPAIFRQRRVGRHGRPFTLYKLRGMYRDARERWPHLYDYACDAATIQDLRFHPEQDPRVTRVGRVLRRTSIDELPNMINVLKGDMSIVGPRPEIPEMMAHYEPAATAALLSVKPGVTGLAKVSGRDELTFGRTLELELEYVHRRSLWLDVRLMWATLWTVMLQHGVLPG